MIHRTKSPFWKESPVKRVAAMLVLSLVAATSWGQDEAKKVVEQITKHYAKLHGCSVTLTMDVEFPNGAPFGLGDLDQTSHASVVKPNQFAFWPSDKPAPMGMPKVQVLCDGKQLISAMPDASVYSIEEAPEKLADLITTPDPEAMLPAHVWDMVAGSQMVIDLMSGSTDKGLLKMLAEAEYRGVQGEDAAARHVFMAVEKDPIAQQETKLEVFVTTGDEAWVTAIKPQLDEMQTQMMGDMSITLRFDNWKSVEGLPEAATFKPEESWKKVDNVLEAALGGMMGEGDEGSAPEELDMDHPAVDAGTTAPEFSLKTLDEKTFTLADCKGKVIVLDFWATWCGPCVAGLPTVTKVTSEYADKGVVFAAVNLREDPDHVRKFMADKEWNFNVAMDSDGGIADLYGVTGIPHSVIIDKTGVVRHVHVGFGGAKQYEVQLRQELDELVRD